MSQYTHTHTHTLTDTLTHNIVYLLCNFRLDLVHVRGKGGRPVSMLLTKDITETIQILIETRKVVSVSPKNTFAFVSSTRNSTKSLRGLKSLSKVIGRVADLERPEL